MASKKQPNQATGMGCLYFIFGLPLVIGLAMLGVGLYHLSFVFISIPGTGTVIDYTVRCNVTRSTEINTDTTTCGHVPVIEHQPDGDETVYTFNSNYMEDDFLYTEGQTVDILYDPTNPGRAELADKVSFWSNPVLQLFVVLGLGMTIAFGLGIFKMWRNKEKPVSTQ